MNQTEIGSNTGRYNTTLLWVFSPNSIFPLFGVPYFQKKKENQWIYSLENIFFIIKCTVYWP